MVEATGGSGSSKMIDTDQPSGILKHGEDFDEKDRHAHFDEHELAEYDKTRGQTMKIDDPKTPFNDDSQEEDDDYDPETAKVEPQIQESLEAAQHNRMANAKTTSGVKRKSNPGAAAATKG